MSSNNPNEWNESFMCFNPRSCFFFNFHGEILVFWRSEPLSRHNTNWINRTHLHLHINRYELWIFGIQFGTFLEMYVYIYYDWLQSCSTTIPRVFSFHFQWVCVWSLFNSRSNNGNTIALCVFFRFYDFMHLPKHFQAPILPVKFSVSKYCSGSHIQHKNVSVQRFHSVLNCLCTWCQSSMYYDSENAKQNFVNITKWDCKQWAPPPSLSLPLLLCDNNDDMIKKERGTEWNGDDYGYVFKMYETTSTMKFELLRQSYGNGRIYWYERRKKKTFRKKWRNFVRHCEP